MIFDPLYLAMIAPAFLLALWAQWRVKSAYARFSDEPNRSGLTGADVARQILRANGILDVHVELVEGVLSDHYSPGEKTLRLSPEVYHGRSIAAAGIAAHEVGHAIQDQRQYAPLVLRQTIAPLAMLGSNLSWILLIFGFVINSFGLISLGIAAFSLGVVFSLVTLPVEFDASKRAKAQLNQLGLVTAGEAPQIGQVLNAAALTYVAGALMAISQLLYFLVRAGLFSSRE